MKDIHAENTAFNAPADFIYQNEQGGMMAPKRFSEKFTAIAQQMELPITLHGLRHSHATMLIAAGVPVKVVSERLGHADVNITQNVYAHVLPHMQQQAVDALKALKNGDSE
ncbi:MAG: tyrosine-type recombinase/integrase [Armatimonadota bacterium]